MSGSARLDEARRALVIGIGGGGDVVGALAFALSAAAAHGSDWIVGGLTWERRVVDPRPGPRTLSQIDGAEPVNGVVALAGPQTTGPGGFLFSESAMAGFLEQPVVLVDPNGGPRRVGAGIDDAAAQLGCDHVVLLDVGGDVIASGGEPGLASPLADAVMLACAEHMRTPATACVFGAGCDGELRPDEVLDRIALLRSAGALGPDLPLAEQAAADARASTGYVVTEASAMALRCAAGDRGTATIRRGARTVELTATGARLICFDPRAAIACAAPLARAVVHADSLDEANVLLAAAGVRTELELERAAASAASGDNRGR